MKKTFYFTLLIIFVLCIIACSGKANDKEITKLLEKAEKGDSFAQFIVGRIYEMGIAVDVDYEKATVWYKKSAEQDFGPRASGLGRSYTHGKGVPQNHTAALHYLENVAFYQIPSNVKKESYITLVKEETFLAQICLVTYYIGQLDFETGIEPNLPLAYTWIQILLNDESIKNTPGDFDKIIWTAEKINDFLNETMTTEEKEAGMANFQSYLRNPDEWRENYLRHSLTNNL